MKTLFLKNGMPITTAVLAIAGAFATTSMQSTSKNLELKIGYTQNPQSMCTEDAPECNPIAVTCSDVPKAQVCRISYPAGQFAFEKTPFNCCFTTLWRP